MDAVPQKPWKERLYDLKAEVLKSPFQRMMINRKYCMQVSKNRDLARAIKEGHLIVYREKISNSTSATFVKVA